MPPFSEIPKATTVKSNQNPKTIAANLITKKKIPPLKISGFFQNSTREQKKKKEKKNFSLYLHTSKPLKTKVGELKKLNKTPRPSSDLARESRTQMSKITKTEESERNSY